MRIIAIDETDDNPRQEYYDKVRQRAGNIYTVQ